MNDLEILQDACRSALAAKSYDEASIYLEAALLRIERNREKAELLGYSDEAGDADDDALDEQMRERQDVYVSRLQDEADDKSGGVATEATRIAREGRINVDAPLGTTRRG